MHSLFPHSTRENPKRRISPPERSSSASPFSREYTTTNRAFSGGLVRRYCPPPETAPITFSSGDPPLLPLAAEIRPYWTAASLWSLLGVNSGGFDTTAANCLVSELSAQNGGINRGGLSPPLMIFNN